jgi:hypothetical protein
MRKALSIWGILPPFCHPIGFESGRGQPLSGTQGKRRATLALVTTIGPEPRPARSTPGEPGRAADRQAFASLSYLANRQVVRNPDVGRPGFLVSMSIHPRTAVRRGRCACLLLTANCKDFSHDPHILSLRQGRRNLASVSGRVKWRRASSARFVPLRLTQDTFLSNATRDKIR